MVVLNPAQVAELWGSIVAGFNAPSVSFRGIPIYAHPGMPKDRMVVAGGGYAAPPDVVVIGIDAARGPDETWYHVCVYCGAEVEPGPHIPPHEFGCRALGAPGSEMAGDPHIVGKIADISAGLVPLPAKPAAKPKQHEPFPAAALTRWRMPNEW